MIRGLVLGKFMPIHAGHMALVDFARKQCDLLYILLCANDDIEPIPGEIRLGWINKIFGSMAGVKICYTDVKIPYTSYSSREISKHWAEFLKNNFSDVKIIFSSETYGEYLAEYMDIEHQMFDQERCATAISATQIRQEPLNFWSYIPEVVRPYFVKKICICGPESTGKSTLAARVAQFFDTVYVPEMARDIVDETANCTMDNLYAIAEAQASEIRRLTKIANKILISDTNLTTTKAYADYLFGAKLNISNNIEEINRFDLYLFLDIDSPFIQDGTRLNEKERNEMRDYHIKQLIEVKANYQILSGTWDEKFQEACCIITENFDL